MRKIRIAQIGTSQNSHGRQIFASLAKQTDLFEVAGFALPEGEREKFPKAVAAFEGYRELTVEEILTDPTIEAVAVETEEKYLTKYALLAAKVGKHIHMEKPGGTDLAAFEKLVSIVKEKGLVFHVGYMYRYNPVIQQLLEEVKSGELGEILSVEAQMNCIHSQEVRDWLKNYPGGDLVATAKTEYTDPAWRDRGAFSETEPFNRYDTMLAAFAQMAAAREFLFL